MISSNITSSSTKLTETVSLAKAAESRKVEPSQLPPVESAAPVVSTDSAENNVELRKAPEKSVSSTEEVDKAMREKVKEAVENVRDFIKKNQRTLDFEMAEESNRVIITVIDRETNKVIRQIPPEDVVNISEQINNGELPSPDGMLVKAKA